MIKIDLDSLHKEVYHALFERSVPERFQRNAVVLEIGAMCNHLYYIEKGMLRNHYYDRKGNDITHWFASEDMIVTSPPSFFQREPSFFRIEAIEETHVRAISKEQLDKALEESQHLERFFRLLVTDIMIMLGRKIISLQTQNAEDRYNELLETHPDIFQRANLGHIAGYLGIKQQSLSRIRASMR